MAKGKKYYWIRLKKTFFGDPKIKKMRRLDGGDTMSIIYLKMMLNPPGSGKDTAKGKGVIVRWGL